MKFNRLDTASVLLVVVIAASTGVFFRFEAPGLYPWLILLLGASLWMSLRSPGFRHALQTWRRAYQDRSGHTHTDPKAQP